MRKGIAKHERLHGVPGVLAIVTVVGAAALCCLVLPFAALFATFGRAPEFGGSEEIGNAGILMLLAAPCALVGLIFVARAFFGGRRQRLLHAAAAAFVLGAVLCVIAAFEIPDAYKFGFAFLLLALTTPWWIFPAATGKILCTIVGVVAAPMLLLWWNTYESSAWSCQPVSAEVAAQLDTAMIYPGAYVREAHAARLKEAPGRWMVAADLHGTDRYQGERDIGVWLLREDDLPPDGTLRPTDTINSFNVVAKRGTNFSSARGSVSLQRSDLRAADLAITCATDALVIQEVTPQNTHA